MEIKEYQQIESKWQEKWIKEETFSVVEDTSKTKYFALMEFPGPSGKGIHMGNARSYIPQDVNVRFQRMKGLNVLYAIGYDAFGLPTENFALQENIHPRIATDNNIKKFHQQFIKLGFSFDWKREIDTTAEEYYKWTQYIFLKLYEKGLAYKSKSFVNYCPHCKVVLSNEDSQGGKCDRCGTSIEQREREVWFLKITAYAEKMLALLNEVDYSESVKTAQRNWIGKSEGAIIKFPIKDSNEVLEIYTTRPDTIYGVTFAVISPEHPIIQEHCKQIKNFNKIEEYKEQTKYKTVFERTELNKDKSGILLDGLSLINPITREVIPVYVADYVIMGYGCGAIMAVPAHDTRDYAFAKKYNISIKAVIQGGNIDQEAYTGDGTLINSDFLNGTNVAQAKEKILNFLEKNKLGYRKVLYKMQDWAFNRQRYWGEPIPIVKCDHCGYVGIRESDLPVVLPYIEDYAPNDNGDSPLSKVKSWLNTKCPKCGAKAIRESDTMPQWAGSSWYWLRYCDPHNSNIFADYNKLKYWGQVDLYTGGVEHVTRHMIYAEFWNLFLFDQGLVPFKNPFKKRICCGLLLGADGEKMSKSKGNAVDPMEILQNHSADALRTYLVFMGDFEKAVVWSDGGINGADRFLNRVWDLPKYIKDGNKHEYEFNIMIKNIIEMYEKFHHNTIVSELMKFLNVVDKDGYITKNEFIAYLKLLYPIAPHITSELYEQYIGGEIYKESLPLCDETKLCKEEVEIPVQINGKLKTVISVCNDLSVDELISTIRRTTNFLTDKEIIKTIFIKNRILNIIVK